MQNVMQRVHASEVVEKKSLLHSGSGTKFVRRCTRVSWSTTPNVSTRSGRVRQACTRDTLQHLAG